LGLTFYRLFNPLFIIIYQKIDIDRPLKIPSAAAHRASVDNFCPRLVKGIFSKFQAINLYINGAISACRGIFSHTAKGGGRGAGYPT